MTGRRVHDIMFSESKTRLVLRVLLAIFYAYAGYAHIARPEGFLAITPGWVPFPEAVIFWTGVAEIAGAIGLLAPRSMLPLRQAAGIGLALYAICVWPANIHHAIYNVAVDGQTLSWWYHGPRFVLQPVFIWLALWVGAVIDWPFRRRM